MHGLSRALVGRGHEVTVFTTDRDGFAPLEPAPPRHAELDGVRVVYHPVGAGARFHRSPDLAHSLERVAEFDLVHVHGLYSWPTTAAARAAGYENAIHALIHDDNRSAERSAAYGATIFRLYVLMGRRLE